MCTASAGAAQALAAAVQAQGVGKRGTATRAAAAEAAGSTYLDHLAVRIAALLIHRRRICDTQLRPAVLPGQLLAVGAGWEERAQRAGVWPEAGGGTGPPDAGQEQRGSAAHANSAVQGACAPMLHDAARFCYRSPLHAHQRCRMVCSCKSLLASAKDWSKRLRLTRHYTAVRQQVDENDAVSLETQPPVHPLSTPLPS